MCAWALGRGPGPRPQEPQDTVAHKVAFKSFPGHLEDRFSPGERGGAVLFPLLDQTIKKSYFQASLFIQNFPMKFSSNDGIVVV